jgi:hypothetical protein
MKQNPGIILFTSSSLLFRIGRYFAPGFLQIIFVLGILFFLAEPVINAQDEVSDFEDISLLYQVAGMESFYTDALYTKKGMLYIPVEEFFNYLKIPCPAGKSGDILEGFIDKAEHTYLINSTKGDITINKTVTDIKTGLTSQMGILYMESSLFGQLFGLNLTFNFRSLAVSLKPDFELPVLKEQRIENLRSNIQKSPGEIIPDTVIDRKYHMFRFGMVDWSVMSAQILNHSAETRLGLGLGAELLGGEANIFVNYSDKYNFDKRQQQYLWRWVNNDKKLVRQVQLGKIATQTISSVYSPVIGATVSNATTSVRKAMGEYTINDVTQPDWYVELYINNVLID